MKVKQQNTKMLNVNELVAQQNMIINNNNNNTFFKGTFHDSQGLYTYTTSYTISLIKSRETTGAGP